MDIPTGKFKCCLYVIMCTCEWYTGCSKSSFTEKEPCKEIDLKQCVNNSCSELRATVLNCTKMSVGGNTETRFDSSKMVLSLIKISENRHDYFRLGKETFGKMFNFVQISNKIECTS
jgi:hypothetical protein